LPDPPDPITRILRTTIHAGTANTESTVTTDNRGYVIGGNRDAKGRALK